MRSIKPAECQQNGGLARCIFKNATNKNTNKPSTYGPVTVSDALAVSSDAFFYKLGEDFFIKDPNLLMAATPLQLANAYATIANRGFLMAPSIVKAIWAPLTPDKSPGVADMSKGKVMQRFDAPTVRKQLEMPGNVLLPIWSGMHRVTHGPGVTYNGFYHDTTGRSLFQGFPVDLAGKTGTAQGAASLPWNDSSVFGAFSEKDDLPYTVVSYLEKSGYGAKAAAPVTKCVFLALDHATAMDPVQISNPLDLTSTQVAAPMQLKSTGCLGITGDLGRG